MKLLSTISTYIVSVLAITCCSVLAVEKRLYHVRGPQLQFDQFLQNHPGVLDIWHRKLLEDGTIEAAVYAPASIGQALLETSGRLLRASDANKSSSLRVLLTDEQYAALAVVEKTAVQACHARTDGYINQLVDCKAFTDSTFHDCWRTSTQVFEYLDKLVALAPTFITKISSIGQTYEGRDIPLYKISINDGRPKRALYAQALIHAREWQAGGSLFYVIAGFLDALRSGNADVTAIFAEFDWYFVPIANIDGYDFSWTDGNRLWRKNRHAFKINNQTYVGVDLNRNYGPREYFDLANASMYPTSEIYPGTGVLSEPEAAAVFNFLHKLPQKLAGAIDVHMNSQTVIRPYSNQAREAPEPFMTKLITLGDRIRTAIQEGSGVQYGNVMGGTGHYLAYGTFKDSIFQEFNYAPGYTLELERADVGFISPQETIRDVGKRTLAAFIAFSKGINAYWA